MRWCEGTGLTGSTRTVISALDERWFVRNASDLNSSDWPKKFGQKAQNEDRIE